MNYLNDKPYIVNSVSHAILRYFELTALQRKHYLVERTRYSEMCKQTRSPKDERGKEIVQRIFALPLSYEYFEQTSLNEENEDDEEQEESDEEDQGDGGNAGNSNKQQLVAEAFRYRICSHAFRNLHHVGKLQSQKS